MNDFHLNPLIASTSFSLGQVDCFDVRLVNDSRYLWLLVIPQIANVIEWHDLSADQRHQLIELSSEIAEILSHHTKADKMNIATIGNIVPAMHLHIIARHKDDEAWPNPIWGNGAPVPYDETAASMRANEARGWLDHLSQ